MVLSWADGPYFGYTIYRDGVLLDFADAGVTLYVDETDDLLDCGSPDSCL